MTSWLSATLRAELLTTFRHRGELANPLVFYVMVIALLPLGVSQDAQLLAAVAPGMLWVMALLATLLSLDGLFRRDFDDGSLEQLLLSPHSLLVMVLSKVLVHWLVTGLPLALLSPLLALMLHLPLQGLSVLVVSLLLGTLTLCLLGAIGAALTVALPRGGLLLSLVIVPLYIPALIFGTASVQHALTGFDVTAELAIQGALLALALAFAPWVAAASLRIGIDDH